MVLYFVRPDHATFEVAVEHLHFTAQGSNGAIGGAATSINSSSITRRGSASSWLPMLDKAPFGTWELALPNTAEIKQLKTFCSFSPTKGEPQPGLRSVFSMR